MTCSTPDCHRAAKSAGLCWACRKRLQRGVDPEAVRPWGDTWATLLAAFEARLDAATGPEADADFARRNGRRSRLDDRLNKAVLRHAAALKRKSRGGSGQTSNPD